MIHIYDAILVGACTAWITWQVLGYRRDRRTQQFLDRLRDRQIRGRDDE